MSEARHLHAVPDDEFLDLAEANIRRLNYPRTDHDIRLLQAVRLAPTLAVAQALLRGEHVPRSALDPDWLRRYGL